MKLKIQCQQREEERELLKKKIEGQKLLHEIKINACQLKHNVCNINHLLLNEASNRQQLLSYENEIWESIFLKKGSILNPNNCSRPQYSNKKSTIHQSHELNELINEEKERSQILFYENDLWKSILLTKESIVNPKNYFRLQCSSEELKKLDEYECAYRERQFMYNEILERNLIKSSESEEICLMIRPHLDKINVIPAKEELKKSQNFSDKIMALNKEKEETIKQLYKDILHKDIIIIKNNHNSTSTYKSKIIIGVILIAACIFSYYLCKEVASQTNDFDKIALPNIQTR